MSRKILAIVAFNVYSLFLVSAFQENTAYLFDASLIKDMKLSGLDVDPREWGWGGHYIWRLFASIVVTALVGFLAGAIAKDNGAKVSAAANIPSVLIWAGMIYLLGFTDVEVEAKTGFIIISIIAIPLTTYIAYLAGGFGEEVQRQEFSDETVLGIKGYHWMWAVFPLYLYSLGIVFVCSKILLFWLAMRGDTSIFPMWHSTSIFHFLLSFALFIAFLTPVVAWIYPLRIVYRILSGNLLANQNAAVKGIAVFGILIAGVPVAAGIQVSIYWLLYTMAS